MYIQFDDPSVKNRDLVDVLVKNVVPRCGCDFREDRITDSVFQCFPSSPQSVTYHAQLHGTLNANVLELIAAIEEWVSSGVTIQIELQSLTVSIACAVNSSTPIELCPGEMMSDVTDTSSSTTTTPV